MSKYHIALIDRPRDWQPAAPDDVPPNAVGSLEVQPEEMDIFAAVRRAGSLNEAAGDKWAVVVDVQTAGKRWREARLCTPVRYQVTSIWRPEGWEPTSPLDVPNCVWRSQSDARREPMDYRRAIDTIRTLNQQSIDLAATMWYVVVAVENEPIGQTIAYDPAGTETTTVVRRLYVVRPEQGGKGDCSHCPGHAFPCAMSTWPAVPDSLLETIQKSPR